jgi:hypothetical protein
MIAVPLDRNEKAGLIHRALCLMRATEKGKHYGVITGKAYDIFAALLMQFQNCGSSRYFPSYKAIAEAAGCEPKITRDVARSPLGPRRPAVWNRNAPA